MCHAQNRDPEAQNLLEKVSAKVNSYDNMVLEFKYVLDNSEENIHQETRGDITLVEVTDELCVRVELHGACADCQMIHMTMKGGVEQAIRQAAPEVVKVEAINWSE